MNQFRRIADATASVAGSPGAFSATVAVTAVLLILGPVFKFSDTWQLSMNTIASQVTFLIALLLQNTQNRDTRALQLKLDELIRSSGNARNQLINLEGWMSPHSIRLNGSFRESATARHPAARRVTSWFNVFQLGR